MFNFQCSMFIEWGYSGSALASFGGAEWGVAFGIQFGASFGQRCAMRYFQRWVCVALFLAMAMTVGAAGSTTEEAENERRVREYWQRVWGEGDLAAVAEFYDPACKQGEKFTIEGFQRGVKRQRESFPDLSVRLDEVLAVGSRVICRVTYLGTHTGRAMFKQEPLGKKVEVPGMDIFVMKDGKCVEHHHVADHLDLVLQMGLQLTPQPTATPPK